MQDLANNVQHAHFYKHFCFFQILPLLLGLFGRIFENHHLIGGPQMTFKEHVLVRQRSKNST